MFLGASFGLEAPQAVHAGVEAGSGEHGDAHAVAWKRSRISKLSDRRPRKRMLVEATSAAAWFVFVSGSRLSCRVKIPTNRAHWACRMKVSVCQRHIRTPSAEGR